MTAILIALLSLQAARNQPPPVYTGATVGPDRVLRITTRAGQTIMIGREIDQVGFEQIAIAEAGSAVGWVTQWPNTGGTSGPIPGSVAVLSGGRVRKLNEDGLPSWEWRFITQGRQVALREGTTHGGLGLTYKLYDVATGNLVAEYIPKVDQYREPLPNQPWPAWVVEFRKRPAK